MHLQSFYLADAETLKSEWVNCAEAPFVLCNSRTTISTYQLYFPVGNSVPEWCHHMTKAFRSERLDIAEKSAI